MSISPLKIILIGLALAVLGVVLPFLMVIHVLESTFLLNFFSHASSTAGLILGIVGAAMHVRLKKK
jgi:hypothetical protein